MSLPRVIKFAGLETADAAVQCPKLAHDKQPVRISH